jgi:hypothetical protein
MEVVTVPCADLALKSIDSRGVVHMSVPEGPEGAEVPEVVEVAEAEPTEG